MAGDTAFSELLLAMGLRSFSMHPSQIVAVKERVLATDARRWSAALPRILAADDPERECVLAASLIAQERVAADAPIRCVRQRCPQLRYSRGPRAAAKRREAPRGPPRPRRFSRGRLDRPFENVPESRSSLRAAFKRIQPVPQGASSLKTDSR
jgi:hypothetical protein